MNEHRTHPIGTRVRTPSGSTGTVTHWGRRAAADIRGADTERARDMMPYTVRLDRDGSFVSYRGHELDPTTAAVGD